MMMLVKEDQEEKVCKRLGKSVLVLFFWFVGISLSVEQWGKLKEAIPKIDQLLHDKS